MTGFKRKKYIDGVDYFSNKDYMAEMNKAKASGDTAALAQLEKERNRKIEAEGLGYKKTFDYMDIGSELSRMQRNGASSPEEFNEYRIARNNKTLLNPQYSQYYNDDIQKNATKHYFDGINGVGEKPEYKERYSQEVDNLINEILNKREFSYDLESDPYYKSMKEAAIREGRRASEDVLADVQQQTGGMSSYAVSAASQAQNRYLSELNDNVPALIDNAYDRYINELSGDYNKLNTLLGLQESDYNRYVNDFNIYDTNRARSDEDYERYNNDMLNEKNYAIETVNMLIENGQTPSRELLTMAGYNSIEDALANISANQKRVIEQGLLAGDLANENAQLINENKQNKINNPGTRKIGEPEDIYTALEYTEDDIQKMENESLIREILTDESITDEEAWAELQELGMTMEELAEYMKKSKEGFSRELVERVRRITNPLREKKENANV